MDLLNNQFLRHSSDSLLNKLCKLPVCIARASGRISPLLVAYDISNFSRIHVSSSALRLDPSEIILSISDGMWECAREHSRFKVWAY